jgi:hypothetical protein
LVVENLVALERKSDFKKIQTVSWDLPMRWGMNNTSRLSRSPALSARSSRGFVPVLAAAVGVASAAFAVPPAALAETPGASTPTQVALPPAASVTDADKRVVADLLFKRLLLKPDDLDAGFQYAQLETELRDYEAAIGALERILYYNPNLPRVNLQLGTLYFHSPARIDNGGCREPGSRPSPTASASRCGPMSAHLFNGFELRPSDFIVAAGPIFHF